MIFSISAFRAAVVSSAASSSCSCRSSRVRRPLIGLGHADDDFHRHELAEVLFQPGVVLDDLGLAVEHLQQVDARPHIDDAVAEAQR